MKKKKMKKKKSLIPIDLQSKAASKFHHIRQHDDLQEFGQRSSLYLVPTEFSSGVSYFDDRFDNKFLECTEA